MIGRMRYQRSGGEILVRLLPGEEIHESLRALARQERLPGATLTGLGAVGEITLAFYDLARRAYLPTELREDLEIVSLTGNLAWAGDEPMAHLHAVVSRPDGSTLGGHVMRGVVSVTLEIAVRVLADRAERRFEEAAGLRLLDLGQAARDQE